MLKGFRNFLMQGELIVIAVGLVVALAFSTLIKSFTDNVITPLINAAGGGGAGANGLGWTINGQRIDVGAFLAAIIYFIIFMAVIYFILVVPYRAYMKKTGNERLRRPRSQQRVPELPVGRPPAWRQRSASSVAARCRRPESSLIPARPPGRRRAGTAHRVAVSEPARGSRVSP